MLWTLISTVQPSIWEKLSLILGVDLDADFLYLVWSGIYLSLS